MDKFGIERDWGDADSPHRDEEWLREQYAKLQSAEAIARLDAVDVTAGAIRAQMDTFGIDRLDPGEAGPEARWGDYDTMSYGTLLDALVQVREETGSWPTSREYDDLRPEGAPATSTAYEFDGFEGWQQALDDAKRRSEQGRSE